MRNVHAASCLLRLCTFAPYSSFSLSFQGDKLLMRPARLPANKQGGRECNLSIPSVSITLACLLGGPSFSTCFSPWALKRLDGQSIGWACVLPHNGLSVSTFFLVSVPSFQFYFSLSLSLSISLFLSFLSSSLSDSFSHGWRQRELLKRAERQREKEEE